jgi:hypothetical protein
MRRRAVLEPGPLTTGLTREQLVKRYGPGVVARVFERAKVIRLTGAEDRSRGL